MLIVDPNVCVQACGEVYREEVLNVPKLLLSVQWYICAPTFSIRPELLAAEGKKKKKICQDA